jgi:hypothetical protein
MIEKFLNLIPESNENGCRLWLRAKSYNGYGVYNSGIKLYGKIERRVHRIIWVIFNGPIPKNLVILHSCDERSCCELSHLRLGTQKENICESVNKGRHSSIICNPMKKESRH